MSWAFVLLFVASCALVAYVASVLVGVAIVPVDKALTRVDAPGRARVWLVLASIPAAASLLVLVAAFGPWAGLTPDHCGNHLASHIHLCFGHPAESASLFLIIPASLLAARVVTRVLRAATVVWRAHTLRAVLMSTSVEQIGDATVLPLAEPVAFVIGWLEPALFVSTGLLGRDGEEVGAVLAHERAHAERRDPLRRLFSTILVAFHLPGVAEALERRLGITQEMAADACAAGELGDPLRIAETLVSVARTRADSGCDTRGAVVSARVRELLANAPRHPGVPVRAFAGAFAAFVLAITISAGAVHHLLEHALTFLGA